MRTATALVLFAVAGCTEHPWVDAAMEHAYRPPHGVRLAQTIAHDTHYRLLAGDLHCHVSPPDAPWHAVRSVRETIELAHAEHLDFVVFEPHVMSRFFMNAEYRDATVADLRAMQHEIDTTPHPGLTVVAGFEYTDHAYGHVGAAFADLAAVLDRVSPEAAIEDPALFFEAWHQAGGLLVIHHPLVVPVDAPLPIARADLSWRAWTRDEPLPPEIAAVNRLAQGVEIYNLAAAHLRDGLLHGDDGLTLRATMARVDQEISRQQRRLTPVGGSDSHSQHLRATTFVLAERNDADALRDALMAGRVCVRSPEACTFRVRAPGGEWQPPGAVIDGARRVEMRAFGSRIELFANGARVAAPASGEAAWIDLAPDTCTVIRAVVGEGYSAPVYVNCTFASRLWGSGIDPTD